MTKSIKLSKLNELQEELSNDNVDDIKLQHIMDKLQSLSIDGFDDAMADAGIMDRDTLIDWLKQRIVNNVNHHQGCFEYLPTESRELQVISDSDDTWWVLDAYEHVEYLSSAVLWDLIDAIKN